MCPKPDSDKDIFGKLDVISKYDEDEVREYVIEKTDELRSPNFKYIEDILTFFARFDGGELDWYEYGKAFFEDDGELQRELGKLFFKIYEDNKNYWTMVNVERRGRVYRLLAAAALKFGAGKLEFKIRDLGYYGKDFTDFLNEADGKKEFKDKKDKIKIKGFDSYAVGGVFKNLLGYDKIEELEEFRDLHVYARYLPQECKFFHFNKTVVLANCSDEVIEKCAESMLKGVGEYMSCRYEIEKAYGNTKPPESREEAEKFGKLLQKFLAWREHLSFRGGNSNDAAKYDAPDTVVAYELVQNANDCHMRSSGLDDELDVQIRDDKIMLRYSDAGFSPKDLISLCSKLVSGKDGEEGVTGEKGIGFKSIYRKFGEVSVKSNYFKITMSQKRRPAFIFEDGDVEIKNGEAKPYKDGEFVEQPIPFFEGNGENRGKTELTISEADNKKELNKAADDFSDFGTYLFTDRINKISVSRDGMTKRITKTCCGENGETLLEVSVNDGSKYTFFKYKGDPEVKTEGIETVVLLFPDERTLETLKREEEQYPLFCTLPLKGITINGKDFRFFVSADIKCERDRKKPCEGEIEKLGKYVRNAFEEFAKRHPQTAYKYYPTGDFYYEVFEDNIDFTGCEIIPTEGGEFIGLYDLLCGSDKYMLAYDDVKDFCGLMNLFSVIYGKDYHKQTTAEILLRHYNKYFGEDILAKPVQTVYEDIGEVVEGYWTKDLLADELEKKFGIEIDERYISYNLDLFENVRETLYDCNDEGKPVMDAFAEKLIKGGYDSDLFEKSAELRWEPRFVDIFGKDKLKKFSEESLDLDYDPPYTELFMYFDGEELPEELKNRFEEYKNNTNSFDSEETFIDNKTAGELMRDAVYFRAEGICRDMDGLYFRSQDEKLVIFGETAFEDILKNLFKLKAEQEFRVIDLPPIYSLPKIRGGKFSGELTDRELFEVAAEAFPRWELDSDGDSRDILLQRTDLVFKADADGEAEYHYNWRGYGAERYGADTLCPVCGAGLFTQGDLELRSTGQVEIPLLMCGNCVKTYCGKGDVYVCKTGDDKNKLECLDRENICGYIAENSEIVLQINVKYTSEDTVCHPWRRTVFLTTPHRLMIFKKFKK
ncbi:MAG: hypothetical protein NC299_01740 [Lachnospiraceae bacterium]|nr:hypothetical protein [Ruminococcus sp.]MCM1274070.1 hypothetical protein [Lachnospiraceae bacterium]